VSCVVRQRSLRRADHSSRGVLPTVLYIYIYDISSLRVKMYLEYGEGVDLIRVASGSINRV